MGRKIELKNEISDPRWYNSFPTTYSWSRFLGFSSLLFFFFLPASSRCRTKGNEWFSYCSNAESLKGSHWSRFHCPSRCGLGLGGCAQSTVAPVAPVGASAGRLAAKQERWKASSNIITDGLSVPFELFTDWVNDYRQCVSWLGARICYPPIRYYQRALPCLVGVLPNHLTEMPTQKQECSECALSPEARARKLRVSDMN